MEYSSKKPIIIGILIAILSIALLFYINSIKPNRVYLIFDNEMVLYEDEIYKNVSFEEIKDEKFRIISQKEFLGDYYADHYDNESDYVFFRLNDESYVFSMPMLAIQQGTNYIDFEKVELDRDDLIDLNDIYQDENIRELRSFREASKVVIDLDNNGEDDKVYSIIYELDDHTYSLVFVNLNGNIQVVAEDNEDTAYSLEYILDVDKDNKYELVLMSASNDIEDYAIYTLKDEYVFSYKTSMGVE